MGKGSDRGRRPGPGRRPPSAADRRREKRPRPDADSAAGPSRLLLTRLVRGTAIWNVYVATGAQGDATSRTHLEFENTSARSERYSRRAEGELLNALFNGAPVSRATLQGELEQALVAAGAIEASEDSVQTVIATDAVDVEPLPAAEAETIAPAPAAIETGAAADAPGEPEPPKPARATRATKPAKAPGAAKTPRSTAAAKGAAKPPAPRAARAKKTADSAGADVDQPPVEPDPAVDGPLSRSG